MPRKQWRRLPKPVRGLTALVGLSIIMLGSTGSVAPTPITQADIPLIIDQPGRYIVTENLSAPVGPPAITIQADHVRLDLNGFTLSGPINAAADCIQGGVGLGIEVAGTPEDPVVDVRITDGAVRGFVTGIQLSNASASPLNALTVTSTCSCGIFLFNANDNHVNQNSASTNFGSGVCAIGSKKNKFHRNSVNDNVLGDEGFGYLFISSDNNVISANDISGNGVEGGFDGILLAGSNNNTIHGSKLQRNGGAGIHILSSSNNTIRANIANANGVYGIRLDNINTGNLIQGNTTNGSIAGIVVDFGASENTITRNTALDNITDLHDSNFGPGCPNAWTNNTFVTKSGNIACIE
jgi:parallel beta-helix repeat protein